MILVDTSVWVSHLRDHDRRLTALLQSNQVWIHPMVVGELACGNLRNRKGVLTLLGNLPQVATATHEEVLLFIERHRLMGSGIGYVDAHLLAAAVFSEPVRLWTQDLRLKNVAAELSVAYPVE